MRRYRYSRPLHREAFTLIELMSVIGIIVILTGLLFPVIARSLEAGHKKVCLSNLRQLGIAFRMYMHDYDEQRPPQLYHLVPTYLSSPSLLVCPSDGTGNYS